MSSLYNYEKRIQHALYGGKGIMKSRKIPEGNKGMLLKYYEFLKANHKSLPRQDKILRTLKRFAEILGDKDFEDVVKEDMVGVMAKITGKPSTIRDFQILVRQFYRWIRDCPKRQYPPEVAWFEIHEPKNNLTRSDLLTTDDVNKMIGATPSFRNKALIATADELGGRIGEFLRLKIKDVKIAETHVELALNGKTGPRPGYLIRRAALFCEWFDAHPQKDRPHAWLWSENGESFKYDAARFMLRYVAKKAGIRKRVYWTLFRHTSATQDASFLHACMHCQQL